MELLSSRARGFPPASAPAIKYAFPFLLPSLEPLYKGLKETCVVLSFDSTKAAVFTQSFPCASKSCL